MLDTIPDTPIRALPFARINAWWSGLNADMSARFPLTVIPVMAATGDRFTAATRSKLINTAVTAVLYAAVFAVIGATWHDGVTAGLAELTALAFIPILQRALLITAVPVYPAQTIDEN